MCCVHVQSAVCVLQRAGGSGAGPGAVCSVSMGDQHWDPGESTGSGPSQSALSLTVSNSVSVSNSDCVCAAVGAGQLHQPGEQGGDREDAAGGTVSFQWP